MLSGKRILLLIGGGIAAYKSLELIRRLREAGASVRCILTKAGAEFVTPLSLAALTGEKVYGELFSLTDEAEMGHIQLSRAADLLVVAPATADLMARMASGLASDLATTALLATDKPVLIAPAMNVRMWHHPATLRNLAQLRQDGIAIVGPNEGEMACGEFGLGRMAEPKEILAAILMQLQPKSLSGRRALVTSGPTFEPIDPVRFIGNRSSGKQGYAIAAALAQAGADTVLVTGPTAEPHPRGVKVIAVERAVDMLAACEAALPVDIAICAAAVADWRAADTVSQKIKKNNGGPPVLSLVENPDILARLSEPSARRPKLVVGFAAETENLLENAKVKRAKKGCDWILANDVGQNADIFGGENNEVHLVTAKGVMPWPRASKREIAARLVQEIHHAFSGEKE